MGNNPQHDDTKRQQDDKSIPLPAQHRPGQGNPSPQRRPDDQRDDHDDQKRSTEKPPSPAE